MVCITYAGEFTVDEQTFTVDLHKLRSPVQVGMILEYIVGYLNTFGHCVGESDILLYPSKLHGEHIIEPGAYAKISFRIFGRS